METILIILATLFGAGTIYAFASGYFNKKNISAVISKVTQKFNKEKIKETEEKQEVLSMEIEKLEDVNEKTKNEIKEIKKEASKKILDTLSKDSIKDIDKGIDDKWGEI